MKRFLVACCVLSIVLWEGVSSWGATTDDIRKRIEEAEGVAGTSMEPTGLDRPKKQPLPDMPEADLKSLLIRSLGDDDGRKPEAAPQTKGKIVLVAEAGDGQISLKWNVIDLEGSAARDLHFTVRYGTEAGKLVRKVDAGSDVAYKIRDLKNSQVYYVQVQGVDKDKNTVALSDVERVVPLAEEFLSSNLEKDYARRPPSLQERFEPDALRRDLKQFGYEFFRNSRGVAQAQENLPVGADYVIGPGDVLRVDLWGSIQGRHELTVDRSGEITIPKVGVVKVWGLPYTQAKETINRAVARYYRGFELNVSLGRLRSIQVYVVGAVEAPGMYSVSALGTAINALAGAGGPTKNGSLRSVRLVRAGKLIQEIDCYDMFLTGDRSSDPRLENGDTVFVPVIGPVVAVAGEVKRPAIYELKGKVTLPEILQVAGGIAPSGDTGRIQVERVEGNSSRIVLDFNPNRKDLATALGDIVLQDRDMVKVFAISPASRQVVLLQGNVARPGEYQFRPGMRLRDLIPDYTMLLPDSYLDAVEITRLAPPDLHREVLSVSLRKVLAGEDKENIELHEQDSIKVFTRWEVLEKPMVAISGQVVNPGVFPFYPNMTVRDLITAAGSLKRSAFLENAELTRVTVEQGKARSSHLFVELNKALAGDPGHNLPLQPDDTLIVRGIENWLEASDRFVTLKGEVRYPGTYSITKGERLSSVIRRAGGYADKAYLLGARFTRKSVQEYQQKRMDEVILRTEKDIMQKQGELVSLSASREELEATRAALDGLLKGIERLKKLKAEGRVVLRLAPLEELARGAYDLELAGGDVLDIPSTPSVVNVIGEVYNPTSMVYLPDKSVSYFLRKSGGPTNNAEEDEMYLIKVDGSVFSRQQTSFGIHWDEEARSWSTGSFLGSRIDPGDSLVVPQKLERVAWMRNIKDITTILSQIALTAGTILLGLK
jgi:protein involved in polysaccharide export with SLBB domain